MMAKPTKSQTETTSTLTALNEVLARVKRIETRVTTLGAKLGHDITASERTHINVTRMLTGGYEVRVDAATVSMSYLRRELAKLIPADDRTGFAYIETDDGRVLCEIDLSNL